MRRRQHAESVESLIAGFAERLLDVVERSIEARTRILTAEWMEVALAARLGSERVIRAPKATPRTRQPPDAVPATRLAETAAVNATTRSRAAGPGSRKRVRTQVETSRATHGGPASTPPSPEQERRDAEFARMRALLKPIGRDDLPGIVDAVSARPAGIVIDPPTDPLRLLEGEVRNQAQGLAQLPAASCTARIAAWAGRVRAYEETNGNRVAADLLLDKLRVLARAMDAGRIEALNGSWRTADWPSYIRKNEALAEATPEALNTLAEPLPERSGDPDYRDVWLQPS